MKEIIMSFGEDSLKRLYCVFGLTAREIGNLVGLTESAILLRLKKINLTPGNRAVRDTGVEIEYTGQRFDVKNLLTKEALDEFIKKGMSDKEIGSLFNMTGEGVAYRRKQWGLSSAKNNYNPRRLLEAASKEAIEADYYSMTVDEFSNKYAVSKIVWIPYIDSIGITRKKDKRINEYPALTPEQTRLIIGGMLGDGGVTNDGRYYEFHAKKQENYLRKKHKILVPYSTPITEQDDGSGFRFDTISHPIFHEFRKLFYREGIKGKLIPVDFIIKNWGDDVLAYWFFDDGCIDDVSGDICISNFCPDFDSLRSLTSFLEGKYQWGFHCSTAGDSIYRVFVSKGYARKFGDLLLNYATSDVYYKVPEISLTKDHVNELTIKEFSDIKPKFYRLADDAQKVSIENIVFEYYRKRGFPFSTLSSERQNYILKSFIEGSVSCENNVISYSTAGMPLCEKFFPNIYKANRKGYKAPLDLWDDDNFLRSLVRNRLRYADRLTSAAMRTGIKLTKACVSNFKPAIAKYIYSSYCSNGKVLDYSCGFGSRMLAAMSLGLEYVGYEPSVDTYENLLKFGDFLRSRTSGTFKILNEGSETGIYKENYFSLAFSSPPYFDFECYSRDPGQSVVRFSSFESWIEGYWKQTMINCYKALTPDGFFGVCFSTRVAEQQIAYTLSQASSIGYYYCGGYKVPFRQVFSGSDSYEVILMFSKVPPKETPIAIDEFFKEVPYKRESLFSELKRNKRESNVEAINEAVIKFKESSLTMGTSRDTYDDPQLLGVPAHVLEHHYGGWNSFVRACGVEPGYVAKSPVEHVKEYLTECIACGEALSFYDYEKRTKIPATRLKRIFNAGRPYAHLRERLFIVALDVSLHEEFLKNFK
jgi:hypothetical protein